MTRATLIAIALATVNAMPASAASFINSTSNYTTVGTANLYNGIGFSYYPINFKKKSVTVGGIADGGVFGSYGAKITGSAKAKFGFDTSISFTNAIQELTSGKVTTQATNLFGDIKPGGGFYFSSSLGSALKSVASVGTGQVDAALNATAFAGAYLYGKACVYHCLEGDIAKLGVGEPADLHILGYHSATNSVTFLDKVIPDALPRDYASDTLPITAHLNAINVSGTSTGQNGNSFHTAQEFAGAYVDVAKTIGQVFGLPDEVFSGSVLGVNYTTLSAKVGLGINAIYDVVTSNLSSEVNYRFSAPVQVFNDDTGKWGAPKTNILLSDKGVFLRTAAPVAHLSILPEVRTLGNVSATLTVNATLNENVRLLEASGYGLSAGPLFEASGQQVLGTLGSFTAKKVFTATAALAPLSLDFLGTNSFAAQTDTNSQMTLAGRLMDTGYKSYVFVPTPGAAAPGDTITGEIRLALNFGTSGCDAEGIDQCRYDMNFTPVGTQQRLIRSATGAPEYSYAVDFETVDRIEALPDGAFGTQATQDSMRQLLANLPPPGSGGYDLPPQIAFNTTPFQDAVPEPATWAMMVGGFGTAGGMMRRRRRVVALVN